MGALRIQTVRAPQEASMAGNVGTSIRGAGDWSPQLAYYTGYSRAAIAVVTDRLLHQAMDVANRIMTCFPTDGGTAAAVDQHVGSFRKRYDHEFLIGIHHALFLLLEGAEVAAHHPRGGAGGPAGGPVASLVGADAAAATVSAPLV